LDQGDRLPWLEALQRSSASITLFEGSDTVRTTRGFADRSCPPGRTGRERAGNRANGEAGQTDTLVIVRGETAPATGSSGTRDLAYRIGWHKFKQKTLGRGTSGRSAVGGHSGGVKGVP